MAVFCGGCGKTLPLGNNFCVFCRRKIQDENADSTKTKTLDDFMAEKRNEKSLKRKQHSPYTTTSSTTTLLGKTSKYKRRDDIVTINVGVIKINENRQLQKIRGSKLPMQVEKNMCYKEVLEIAKNKHGNHDQYFCPLESYVLVYPDNKPCYFIPGSSDKMFTVSEYKKELGKPYSKIDLFLVIEHDLLDDT